MSTSQKRHWKRLVSSYGKTRPATTLEIARSYLTTYSDDGAAWLILGDVLSDLAQYDESAKAMRKSIRLFPRDRLEMPYSSV